MKLIEIFKQTETPATAAVKPELTATLTQKGDVYGILIDLARHLPQENLVVVAPQLQSLETWHTLAHQYIPSNPDHALPKNPISKDK